jgi:hypothetical protein
MASVRASLVGVSMGTFAVRTVCPSAFTANSNNCSPGIGRCSITQPVETDSRT